MKNNLFRMILEKCIKSKTILLLNVGSSLGYDNLFRYVINNQQVEKDVADMMENYQDFVHNWLDYQYDIKEIF